MDRKQLLSKINEIVKQNKLDVSKKFTPEYLSQKGFFPEAEGVADDAIKKIYDICVRGVNEGFSRDTRNVIYDLSDIVVTLTKVKSDHKKIKNIRGQVDKVNISMGKKNISLVEDPRKVVTSYVNTTIGAIDSILNNKELFGESIEGQRSNMEALKAKLQTLLVHLEKVSNTTSKYAAEKVCQIVDELKRIRKSLSSLFCSLKVVARADTAIALVDQWAAIVETTGRKEFAKECDMPKYDYDHISALAEATPYLDELKLFIKRFTEEEEKVTNPPRVREMREKIDQINVELAKITDEQKQIVIELRNTGDRLKLGPKANKLKIQRESLEKQKENYQLQIDRIMHTIEKRRRLLNTFNNDVYLSIINEMQMNPIQLCLTISMMDFESILSMLGTDFTEEDVKAALRTLTTARVQAQARYRELDIVVGDVSDTLSILDEEDESLFNDETLSHGQQTRQSADDALDELLAMYGEETEMEEVEQEQNQQNAQNTVGILSDDDN